MVLYKVFDIMYTHQSNRNGETFSVGSYIMSTSISSLEASCGNFSCVYGLQHVSPYFQNIEDPILFFKQIQLPRSQGIIALQLHAIIFRISGGIGSTLCIATGCIASIVVLFGQVKVDQGRGHETKQDIESVLS